MSRVLWGYDVSPFSDKVQRALRWKGLEFAWREVLVSKTGRYKSVSPTGKFPVLDDTGTLVRDSTDILRYLDAIYPERSLLPDDPRDRALAVILEDWADESLYFFDLTMRAWPQNREWFVRDLLHHESALPRRVLGALIPGALAKAAKSQGRGRRSEAEVAAELAALYDALEALLTGAEWLAGPRLSSADLAVRAMLNVLDRTLEGKALRESRPALNGWCARTDTNASPEGLSV